MSRRWVYYVSGHGYGHACRSAHIAREFARRWPDVHIDIRTTAAPFIFQNLGANVHSQHVEIDRGVIEDSPLRLNWDKTIANLRGLVDHKDELARAEAESLRQTGAELILADIPWLAGYVAEAASLPCYAQGNFTWDWIYQPHLSRSAEGRAMLDVFTGGYQRMSGWLRLPFPHEYPHLERTIDLPLVDTPAHLPPAAVLAKLGIAAADTRPRVYLAMRDRTGIDALSHAVAEDPGLLYLCNRPADGSLPAGAVGIPADLRFWDTLSVCDAVISKLGHGIVTDTLSHRVRLLWPQRNGFREDPMLAAGATEYCPNAPLPADDFAAGRWAGHVRRLLATPFPARRHPTGGAAVAAQWIAQRLGLSPAV